MKDWQYRPFNRRFIFWQYVCSRGMFLLISTGILFVVGAAISEGILLLGGVAFFTTVILILPCLVMMAHTAGQ